MAETVVSMARALVGVAVSKAASAAAHEASLLLGVQKEIWYIKDELKTIQAFLRAAEVEKNKGELLKVWAEQVQDLSYDIEDCLDEFKVHVKSQSLSGQLLKLGDRHRIAVRIHNLKSRVEEVSNRNTRYSLIKTTSSSSTDERDSYMEDMRNQSVNNIVESELVGFASPKMDLLKLIDISSDDGPTKVICVVGMGGLGKTTLARKTYESKEDIPSYFPCCAWVIVSQSFDRKEILKDMIRQLLGADSLNKLLKELQGKLLVQVQHLADCLVHGLKDKRYFVVLDDLWSIDAWNWINDIAFPKINNRGSRILITTRDAGLAERCTSEPLIYHLEPLQIDDAVHLLLRKTSKGQKVMETGENMKNIVTKLVKKCGCLPLAILTVGGILATKNIAEWGKFYKELPSELESNPNLEAMRRIVILSYNHLPSHLKPCFLYLSIFPEDFAIQRKRLVDRWIAEGFVKARDAVNIEDVGNSYFNELINRSMIQPSAVNIEGVVKKCRVHDIMRDIMVSVSREQNFVLLTKDNITSVEEETIRHVAFHGNQFSEICLDWSSVRSVSVFGCRPMELVPSFCSPQLRMLRVLDLEDVKFRLTQKDVKNIGLLHHMKYLNIAGGSYDLALLRSIGKLQCLQTLDMREANISALPTAITELKSLCSLRCSKKLDYGYFNLIDNPKGCMTITMCFPMIFATLVGFSDRANLIAEIQLACSTRWSDTKGVRLPRGIKSLKKLQILEDADPVHYGFLKYLFIHSCEPYFNFIKSWIYRASVDDPYEEFLITQTENKDTRGDSSDVLDEFTPFPLKGRNHVSAPCFLKEICHPLLRTGQQLQVLMKLLKSCNLSATGGDTYPSHNNIRMEGVLPWFNTPIESSMNSFTFSKSSVEAGTCKRDAMYKLMMEKLQHFFSNVKVIPFDTASNFLHKGTDPLDTSVSDAELYYGDSDAALACKIAADEKDNDASSASQEFSDKEDPLESSECSSYTSMDDVEVESATACDNLSSSMSLPYCTSTSEAKCPPVTGKLLSSQASSVNHGINHASPIDESEKDDNFNCRHVPTHSQNIKHNAVLDALELDYQYSHFSPFDRFMKRTSCSSEKMNSVEFLYTDHESSVQKVSHVYPLHSESGSPRLLNSKNYEKSGKINQAWSTSIPYNLSLNPILKNAACCHTESDLQHKSKNRALASFDFESVTDPCEVYCERSPSCLVESVNGAATVVQPRTEPSGQPDCSSKLLQTDARSQAYLTSSGEVAEEVNLQEIASGGSFWEKSLQYNDKSKEKTAGDFSSQFDMPLDIVIDKCIMQEVLLQYKYVSSFTMKLLEEGFDLHAHLLALRRYHFMELADWADSFIFSIYHKKWSFVKSEQKRAEIQGLMDLALQRSSCDYDPYKERLFIYMREQPIVSFDASACGLDMLDDILLGYKAEWPVNIVITEDTLKIYAEIFCYLLQVRFAVFSLTEVWRFLKELTQFISRSSHSRPDVMKKLNFVMRVRHKVYHFLSTLQQYLHCHLSDISWRRFQHSLKNQVRDILDLECVHMCYITDALDICFLSDESKQVATIIKSMLQLALELRSCFQSLGNTCDLPVNQLSDLHSLINFSQVDAIRTRFEVNIKDLYTLHSKSSKYGELGLSRFWGYLNYNEYHSTKISMDMGIFCF